MVATGKTCGECGMCCKLLGITTLDKPGGVWCRHFKRGSGGGCGVYAERPQACVGFECLWLDSEKLDAAWRPDRAKFLMFTEQDGRRLTLVVDPASPAAWRREPYYARIKAMSQRAYDGFELLVCIGDRRIVVFPHEDVDLGVINPEHKIVSGYADRDGQKVPFAIVMSDLPEQPAPSA